MKRPIIQIFFLWLLIFTPIACSDGPDEPEKHGASTKNYHSSVVSLYSVVAHPERYSGRRVTVFGYYQKSTAYDSAFLFISQDHAMHRDYASSITLENIDKKGQTPSNLCGGQYVRVTGTLNIIEGLSGIMETLVVVAAPYNIRISRTGSAGTRCWPPRSTMKSHSLAIPQVR